ncbi:O-antigen ligase family protein [Vibrio tapetis]|uniref:O-antigen polymerase n=1 Tax=Vibrio tapetis subsp. tapetis TaxID=1671868 RepID=A0A2N8ZLL6_9VIBR|nr:O-antigen ligase family protein [Vibrio tapetis]SON52787.1 O-antigen polymerase [Vibrio tapetis subsp. tapetis]
MRNSTLYQLSAVLFYVLLFRASMDPVLHLTKVGGIGLGAVLNLMMVAYFLYVCAKNRMVIPRAFVSVWGVFIIIGLVSIISSPDKVRSLRTFFGVLTYMSVFCLSAYFIKSKQDLVYVIKLVILSSIIQFTFTFVEFLNPSASTTKDGFRLFGSFSHPNIYAFYLVLIASLCFFVNKQKTLQFDHGLILISKLVFVVALVFLILTKTRSAWGAFTIVIAVYGILSERRYLYYLTAAVFVALMVPAVQERVMDVFTSGTSIESLEDGEALNSYAWRLVVWAASWDYILAKPLFGHGYDTFSYYFLDFFPLEESRGFDAHNTYVQLVFDMGFLGLAGYLIIFIAIFRRLFAYFHDDKQGATIIIGLATSYLVVGYSDNILFYLSYNWYFWLVMGFFYFSNPPISNKNRKTSSNVRGYN